MAIAEVLRLSSGVQLKLLEALGWLRIRRASVESNEAGDV
jgi:hypothetical protein